MPSGRACWNCYVLLFSFLSVGLFFSLLYILITQLDLISLSAFVSFLFSLLPGILFSPAMLVCFCWFPLIVRCRTEKQLFPFHEVDGFFFSCLYKSILSQESPFFSGVSFSDHLVLQVSTELTFSLQFLSSITTSDFHLNSVSAPSWISHVKLCQISIWS